MKQDPETQFQRLQSRGIFFAALSTLTTAVLIVLLNVINVAVINRIETIFNENNKIQKELIEDEAYKLIAADTREELALFSMHFQTTYWATQEVVSMIMVISIIWEILLVVAVIILFVLFRRTKRFKP